MEHVYTLRPLKDRDAVRMLQWMQDETVTEFLQIGGKNTSLESVQRFIASAQDESENLHRAIVDERDIYYGTVSLKHIDHEKGEAEYAIAMHMEGIGTGASSAANRMIFDYAKNIGFRRLYLYVNPDNQRAMRFYEKNGWVRFKPELSAGSFLWFEALLGQ